MKNNELKQIVRKRKVAHLASLGKFRVQIEIPLPLLEKINMIARAERRPRNAQILELLDWSVERYESLNKGRNHE